MQDQVKDFKLYQHPRISYDISYDKQSIIFPGTEKNEKIHISSLLKKPQNNPENLENWYIKDFGKVKTLYDFWANTRDTKSHKKFLGTRTNTGFSWQTFGEISKKVNKISTILIKTFSLNHGTDTLIGLLAANSWQWTAVSLACYCQNVVHVPMYDTLGDEAMAYISDQCKFDCIFIDNAARCTRFVDMMIKGLETPNFHKVKIIITFNKMSDDLVKKSSNFGIEIHFLNDLLDTVADGTEVEDHPPKPSDLAGLNYTSGTTGNPKGVMLTHEATVCQVFQCMFAVPVVEDDNVWLSYLPAAHVFEKLFQCIAILTGTALGFFSGDPRKLLEDAQALKPTMFGGVPRVWNRIAGSLEAAKTESWFKKVLIEWAVKNKIEMMEKGTYTKNSIFDKFVFNKFQAALGGRVRAIISGAAPLKPEVLNTLRAMFGCPMIEGYGQTECAGVSNISTLGDTKASVGPPSISCSVKLASVPEMNYFKEDDKGEVCVKGPILMTGYFKNKSKTDEAIDKEGWLHTGDIGQWTEQGTLQIIDRLKHIFKLQQGEYVAPEKIENVYVQHVAIAQNFIHGNSLENYLVGLIFLDPENAPNWAANHGFSRDLKELSRDENANKTLLSEINVIARKSGLKGFEMAKKIKLLDSLMSVDNELITPSQKTKRAVVANFFKDDLVKMYEN